MYRVTWVSVNGEGRYTTDSLIHAQEMFNRKKEAEGVDSVYLTVNSTGFVIDVWEGEG